MTNKELLLKDLCARLPHGVHVDYKGEIYGVLGISYGRLVLCKPFMSRPLEYYPLAEEVKSYLFPLSSMTEEQREEYHSIIYRSIELHYNEYCDVIDIDFFDVLQEFYLKNHFDYRGLIEKGLAIDATGLNIY